jgi:hypothetical protein
MLAAVRAVAALPWRGVPACLKPLITKQLNKGLDEVKKSSCLCVERDNVAGDLRALSDVVKQLPKDLGRDKAPDFAARAKALDEKAPSESKTTFSCKTG